MWVKVRLSKDEDDFKRIIQNMVVQRIYIVFETVQAQIRNLRLRDQEIYGSSEQVDWTDAHWNKHPLRDGRISERFKSKVCVFSDSVLCIGAKM